MIEAELWSLFGIGGQVGALQMVQALIYGWEYDEICMSMSGQDIHFVVELELSLVLTHRQMPSICCRR